MTILGGRTEQLDISAMSLALRDFLSFIVEEHIRFFHGALQFIDVTGHLLNISHRLDLPSMLSHPYHCFVQDEETV